MLRFQLVVVDFNTSSDLVDLRIPSKIILLIDSDISSSFTPLESSFRRGFCILLLVYPIGPKNVTMWRVYTTSGYFNLCAILNTFKHFYQLPIFEE